MKLILAAALVALTSAAQAQTVTTCERWEANARNLAEPWEDNTRTFANGNIRLAVVDTIEPAAGSFHLLILSPPLGVLGDPQCRMISNDSTGFTSIDFGSLTAGYDPQTGLGLDMFVRVYNPNTADFDGKGLGLTINQATGAIGANLYPND